MVIVFGICLLFVVVGLALLIHFHTRKTKLVFAVSNIVSLIFLLVYIYILYRKSSPIVNSIITSLLNPSSSSYIVFYFISFFIFFLLLGLFPSHIVLLVWYILYPFLWTLYMFFKVSYFIIGLCKKFMHCLLSPCRKHIYWLSKLWEKFVYWLQD